MRLYSLLRSLFDGLARSPVRWFLCSALAAWLLPVTIAFPQSPSTSDQGESELLQSVDRVLEELVRLRSIPSNREIQRGIRSKEQIRSYLVDRIEEDFPREEVLMEERFLKRLGLIPGEMDLYTFMIDLLTEQIAGFYDPHSATFFMADWLPLEAQEPVMAHELTHALQDQVIDLGEILDANLENDDMTLAQQAVFEGEATVAAFAYVLAPTGRDVRSLPDLVALSRAAMKMEEEKYDLFRQAPLYLREMITFPYVYGSRFIQAFLEENPWAEIVDLYNRLPSSTEQIIHPARYFQILDHPRRVDAEAEALRPEGFTEVLYSTVFGEFGFQVFFDHYLGIEDAGRAASGWDGDLFELIANGEGDEALVLVTVWDSVKDAREFAEVYRRATDARFGGAVRWECESEDRCNGVSGAIRLRIEADEDRVDVVEWEEPSPSAP